MASSLGSFFEGINQGARIGMGMYELVRNEERAKRQEQYQRERDQRSDFVADRAFEQGVTEFETTQNNWRENFRESQRVNDANIANQQHSQRIASRQQSLQERKHQDQRSDAERQRRLAGATLVAQNALRDDSGRHITDPQQLADRLNRDPAAMRSFMTVAEETGLIDKERSKNYTGGRFVVGPDGNMVLQVAGRDGTGAPINGTAFLSDRGTSDPDDPYVAFNPQMLARMVDPQYNEALRSVALANEQIAANDQASLAAQQATVGGFEQAMGQADMELARAEQQLLDLQEQRAQVRDTISRPDGQHANPEAVRLDQQISSLAAQLDVARGNLGALTQRRDQAVANYDGQRRSFAERTQAAQRLHGPQYASLAQAAAAAAPETGRKQREAAEKSFGSFAKEVISRNASKPRKGEPEPRVTAADLSVALNTLSPELRAQIGANPNMQASVERAVQAMTRSGVNSGLEYLILADAAGADLDTYAQLVGSPQMAGLSDEERHAQALAAAQMHQANPAMDVDTVAGRSLMGWQPARDR